MTSPKIINIESNIMKNKYESASSNRNKIPLSQRSSNKKTKSDEKEKSS
jgi:hypothetical protein